MNFFPEKTLSQLYQSEKKEEWLPDVIAIELQRASSVLNLNLKKKRKTFSPQSWDVIMTSQTQYADEFNQTEVRMNVKSTRKKGFSLIIKNMLTMYVHAY